jgi:hypothetical protein
VVRVREQAWQHLEIAQSSAQGGRRNTKPGLAIYTRHFDLIEQCS